MRMILTSCMGIKWRLKYVKQTEVTHTEKVHLVVGFLKHRKDLSVRFCMKREAREKSCFCVLGNNDYLMFVVEKKDFEMYFQKNEWKPQFVDTNDFFKLIVFVRT